jgi:Kef-type K+ transport system membrane component KefB
MPAIIRLIIQMVVIICVARAVGAVFRKIRQPQVMGEMVAGIVLGPSLLGLLAPHAMTALFPASSLGYLNAVSQIGLVLFMFLVGLGINPKELKTQGHAAVLVSHISITAPFVLAAFLALFLYPRLSDSSVSFSNFALFMGAAMSITAFPVLARILSERNMVDTRLGTIAISCAAVDDVTGWAVLAYIVALVRAHGSNTPPWLTLLGSLAFVLVMLCVVKRLLRYFAAAYDRSGQLSDNMLALIVLLVLGSALATEWLGVHLLFGAFLLGAIMPKDPALVRYLTDKFEFIPVVVLLPTFFALTGFRTSISLVRGPSMAFYCIMIIVVAIVGKLGGSTLAARITGSPVREATALGVLMNTRGLMELVILNIGREIKVISPALFSMMVFMALVTTFMTSPLLEWICPERLLRIEAKPVHIRDEDSPLRAAIG